QQIQDKWYLGLRDKIMKSPLNFPRWRVTDGKIYKYIKLDFPDLRNSTDYWKLVVPKENRSEILKSCHDSTIGGHLGVHKTYLKICRLYYWPCMRSHVTKYVKHCIVCQRVKPEQKLPGGLMRGNLIPKHCWQVISMDLFGPLPKSKSGNMYIFVVTDIFSKFNYFFAIRKANSKTIINLLEERIFLIHGIPEVIRCDNGVQFKSREFGNLTQKYGVKTIFNPNYHPSPNVTERVNRVLKSMLSAFVSDNQRNWDIDLATLACAVNTAVHEVTGRTPYFVNFGRDMILHGSEYSKTDVIDSAGDVDIDHNNLVRRVEALIKMREFVNKRLIQAHQRSKDQYNLRRRDVDFQIGDLVWKRLFALSDAGNYFSAKLAGKFEGPFKVSKRVGYCVYELEDMNGKSKGNWHCQDLKKYYSPADID
ncbi:MAG: integrase, partial [Nitrosopumilaceae archaeon]